MLADHAFLARTLLAVIRRAALKALLISALLPAPFFPHPVRAANDVEITGQASVIDGDTVEIAGTRIRLHAIDAPESRQTCERDSHAWRCGQQSALALADYVGRHVITCETRGTDRYKRVLAVCYRGGQQRIDLNGWMVEQGWALAYRQYSRDYVDEEKKAQAARRGLWAGTFQPPWEWRRGHR